MDYSLLLQLGFKLPDDQLGDVLWRYKEMAEHKKVNGISGPLYTPSQELLINDNHI